MLPLKPHTIAWLVAGANIPTISFNTQQSLTTQKLTHALDSLVRVSRRVERRQLTSFSGIQTKAGLASKQGSKCTLRETTTPNIPKHQLKHSHTQSAGFHVPDHMLKYIRPLTIKDSNTTLSYFQLHTCISHAYKATYKGSNLSSVFKHPSLPVQQFQALLTLFPKSFSCFPHGTCLLSVSHS